MSFQYPPQPLVRRHGPQGYRDRESFRPWLRDDFSFRCVFCLRREQWDRATSLHIDHYQPISRVPSHELHYDNLLYACSRCNGAKSNQITPDPCRYLLADLMTVQLDGTILSTEPNGLKIIAQLRLNAPEVVHFRRIWLEIILMAKCSNQELYRELLGFPEDLPNLGELNPPDGNERPAGLDQSFYARRQQGQLADTY